MNPEKNQNQVSRRKFIRKAAIGVAGASVYPTLLTSCNNVKGANDRLQIGHIGVGTRGGVEYTRYFLPLEESRSIAISDLFKERRDRAAAFAKKFYKENNMSAPRAKSIHHYEEMLEMPEIDAVNITIPDHWHLLAAIRAAEAGKHIMLAKPLGLSYPNYMKLRKVVHDNGVKFHYGVQQRASEHMRIGIDMIREGLIGDVERVEVWAPGKANMESPVCNEVPVPDGFDYEKWLGPAPVAPYCPERVTKEGSWFTYDYSIGFLAGWGAHPLDIMVWGLKDLLSGNYTCEGSGMKWPVGGLFNNIITWDLAYEYDNGLVVHFTDTDTAGKGGVLDHLNKKDGDGTTFYGTKGWISLSRSSCQSDIPEIEQRLQNASTASGSMGQKFLDVIKGRIDELCPLDDAIISDTISHMGDIAIRMGRKITWDPKRGEVLNEPEANKLFEREMRQPYSI